MQVVVVVVALLLWVYWKVLVFDDRMVDLLYLMLLLFEWMQERRHSPALTMMVGE